jgi:membrane protein involved in colicin uptake
MIGKGAATETNTENNINVTINVASDGTTTSSAQASEGSNGPDFNKLGGMMTQVIQQELLNQQRPGGLLSPY